MDENLRSIIEQIKKEIDREWLEPLFVFTPPARHSPVYEVGVRNPCGLINMASFT